jgi:hypothetical protein
MFLDATHDPTFLDILRDKMQAYHRSKPITIRNGLFEDATAVQIDTCRLAALMVEPRMFAFLVEKSDPPQGRTASDNPALRAQTLAQLAMVELMRLHNDAAFMPTNNADISQWCRDMFICIAQPAEERDYAWIATTFRSVTRLPCTCMFMHVTCHVKDHQDNDGNFHEQFHRERQAGQRSKRLRARHRIFYKVHAHIHCYVGYLTASAGFATSSPCGCSFICSGITVAIQTSLGTLSCCLTTCA